MTDSPDAIRADIERTRHELGGDVDALADKVTPSKIAERQTRKVRAAFTSVRERVMGAADDTGAAASDATDAVAGLAHDAKAKAEGNPLAVGLIAFGAGLLVAALIPASRTEKKAAEAVKAQAQPLVDEAAGIAKDMAGELKEPMQDAVGSVTERAKEAAHTVADEASDAGHEVKDRAQQAQQNVSET